MNEIELPVAKHDRDFVIGVGIGQAREFTAIATFERIEELTGKAEEGRWTTRVRYKLPHLERPPLGTPYPVIIKRLQKLIAGLPAHGRLNVVVDQTGCGRPVVDLMRKEGLRIIPVTVTTIGVAHFERGTYNLPKRELISNLAILLQSERLKIARALPDAAAHIGELQNFKMTTTPAGNDAYGAWRQSDHDDLLLAGAIACWYAERRLGSILKLPPMPAPPIARRPPTMDELIKMQPKLGGESRRRM